MEGKRSRACTTNIQEPEKKIVKLKCVIDRDLLRNRGPTSDLSWEDVSEERRVLARFDDVMAQY